MLSDQQIRQLGPNYKLYLFGKYECNPFDLSTLKSKEIPLTDKLIMCDMWENAPYWTNNSDVKEDWKVLDAILKKANTPGIHNGSVCIAVFRYICTHHTVIREDESFRNTCKTKYNDEFKHTKFFNELTPEEKDQLEHF